MLDYLMSSLNEILSQLINVTLYSAHVWVKEIGNHAKKRSE